MSFFDLENELPCWLDAVIAIYSGSGLKEMTVQADINKLDKASLYSYHSFCADRGNMVTGSGRHIWKFQAPMGDIRSYGKYLDFNGTLQFWLGIVVENKVVNLYLWFGTKPSIRQHLQAMLDEIVETYGYWYKLKAANSKQLEETLTANYGCGAHPLKGQQLSAMEQTVKDAARALLKEVEQGLQKI